MSKKILITLFLAIIVFTQFANTIYAVTIDTNRTVSLTIIEYENAYGEGKNSSENVPLSGVEITIYKLNDINYNLTAQEIVERLDRGITRLTPQTLTTDSNGEVTFTNLEQGRYLVRQTNSPANVNVEMEAFLIDLPRTADDGKSWNYDVTVEPKNITVYGNVALTQTSTSSDILEDATWELQVKNSSNEWEKYNYDGTLATDSNGQISLSNLPAGEYRFVATGAPEGYILDSSNTQEFEITSENTTQSLSITSEKPSINQQVKLDDGYGKAVGANSTDTVEWKITTDIPSIIEKMNTYSITDSLPNELDFVSNSFNVYGDNQLLTLNTDYTLTQTENSNGKSLKLDFITSNLSQYNSITFTYQTSFNSSVVYGEAITNSATLTYTNNIDITGTPVSTFTSNSTSAEVHTGALKIQKVDYGFNALAGAKFKISKTYEDAKNKIYIKDVVKEANKQSDDEDTDLIAISGEDGYFNFYGLKYGDDDVAANEAFSTYYITEIESPTYEENGELKHYQLLSDSYPVYVDKDSGNEAEYGQKVMNKKQFTLPITGATGTIGFALIGGFLIIIAIKKKKKNAKASK